MQHIDTDLIRLACAFACWNAHVHYELTKQWAREEGYTEADAEEVAHWDLWTDRLYPGNRRKTKGFHFPAHGAKERAETFLGKALAERKLGYLGIALHCAQDAIGHGPLGHLLHVPPIDTWARRREHVRERTEQESRRLLRAYRDAR